MVISNSVRFWLYLILFIPSLIFTMVGLYRLRINRTLDTRLKNHDKFLVLSCVLIGKLFAVAWLIHYYRAGTVLSPAPAFCIIWTVIDSAMPVSLSVLIAWASIERCITTFHSDWLATSVKRLFFHYCPLGVRIVYPTSFYFVIFFTMLCDIPFNYDTRLCNRSECMYHSHSVALWDSDIHYILPVCITMISSAALLVRVTHCRYRIYDRMKCDRYKKIVIKMLLVSFFYILLQVPPTLLYIAYITGLSRSIAADYYSNSTFCRYWFVLFIPFIYITPFAELRRQQRRIVVFWKKRHVVKPVAISIAPKNIGKSSHAASIGCQLDVHRYIQDQKKYLVFIKHFQTFFVIV